jgi:hypothetical protein
MARQIADVPIEDVERREPDGHREVEAELDDGNQRDQEQGHGQPRLIENQHQPRERDEAEQEIDDPGARRGDWQHELWELDLADQPVRTGDRRDRVLDR